MRSNPKNHQGGFALLVTSVLLVLVAILSLVTLEHAGSEAAASARSRSSERTVQAADAGVQLALARLSTSPPTLDPINMMIGDVTVQSRRRTQSSPQNIEFLGSGPIGDLYRVTITAVSPNGSTSEIEAKFGVDMSGGGVSTSGGY